MVQSPSPERRGPGGSGPEEAGEGIGWPGGSPGAGGAPDPARLQEGWEYRFVQQGERAEEMIRLYRELGFEVASDPVPGGGGAGGCTDCFAGTRLEFRSIYTRRPGTGARRVTHEGGPADEPR